MTMPRRRFRPLGTVAAAFAFLLAVLPLVAAPALAGAKAAQPHDMMMSGISANSDGPCANEARGADLAHDKHMEGRHAQNCLAMCLIAHGVLLPMFPHPDAAWPSATALFEASGNRDLRALAFGIDPPPPRHS